MMMTEGHVVPEEQLVMMTMRKKILQLEARDEADATKMVHCFHVTFLSFIATQDKHLPPNISVGKAFESQCPTLVVVGSIPALGVSVRHVLFPSFC